MSVRIKALLSLIVTFLLLFIVVFLLAQQVILRSFATLERRLVEEDVERVLNGVANIAHDLEIWAQDYAYWDDAYNYTTGSNPDFIIENLYPDALVNLGVNFSIITDTSGEILFARGVDLETEQGIPIPQVLRQYVFSLAQNNAFAAENRKQAVSGFLWDSESDQLLLFATRAVLNAAQDSPVGGTLSWALVFDNTVVKNLASTLRIAIEVYTNSAALVPSSVAVARSRLNQPGEIDVQITADNLLAGHTKVVDINDFPVALIAVQLPRDVYSEGQRTVLVMAVVLLITGTLLCMMTYLVMDRIVINRITNLSEEVNTIQTFNTRSQRVKVRSNDEVTELSKSINAMLSRLEHTQRDITRKARELQSAYRQAQEATQLKSEFLSTMSHELRTPLNAIMGYSGIILEGVVGELDPEVMRMIGQIYNSSQHLLSLVNDILDLSKIEAGRLQIVDNPFVLADLLLNIEEQMGVLAAQKDLAFRVKIAPEMPEVIVGDEERIKQVLINLLSNAFKFTEQGGVTVNIDRIPDDEDDFTIVVTDTGIGMPPEALEYIFEEFRQVDGSSSRSYQGTGLGLAIVRKLTELMGGQITVTSEVGKGSQFTIVMPLKVVSTDTEDNSASENKSALPDVLSLI